MRSEQPRLARPRWRDLAIAFTVAHYCFIRVWAETAVFASRENVSILATPHYAIQYCALVLNELLLTIVIWLWWRWAGPGQTAAQRLVRMVGSLVFGAIGGYGFRSLLIPYNIPLVTWGLQRLLHSAVTVSAAALVVISACFVIGKRRLVIGLRGALLVMSLSAMANVVTAVWSVSRVDRAQWNQPPLGGMLRGGLKHINRVVFVLFDEWDQRLTFEQRDPPIELPAFDCFRSESLYATQALQGGPRTMQSIPEITTGQVVEGVSVRGPNEFLIKTQDGFHEWKQMNHMFGRARALGVNVAIVGWYIPYCRLFADSVASCWNWPWGYSLLPIQSGLMEASSTQMRRILETDRFSPWGQTTTARLWWKARSEELARAKLAASDGSYGFVYMHLPVTHGPYYYDRHTMAVGLKNETKDGYLSSLVWADHEFGEIKNSMQTSGLWDTSTVILTSDHAQRTSAFGGTGDHRVPLMIRMPGQREQITVQTAIETRVLSGAVIGLLEGSLRNPAELRRFLTNASTGR